MLLIIAFGKVRRGIAQLAFWAFAKISSKTWDLAQTWQIRRSCRLRTEA